MSPLFHYLERIESVFGQPNSITLHPVRDMTRMPSDISETLREDLYEKTRAQLNTFLDETNALLAAGDALHEDRTATARERLTDFLKGVDASVVTIEQEPPLTRVLGDVKRYVKERPLIAVGAAAGVGLIASLLLMRDRH